MADSSGDERDRPASGSASVGPGRRVVDGVVSHSRLVIVVMLVLTVAVGAGLPMVESDSALDQFQSDTREAEKLAYIEENFADDDATTSAQIVVRGDDVLTRDAMISMLEYQQELRNNGTIEPTLAGDDPTVGVPNAVATAAIEMEASEQLERERERRAEPDRMVDNRSSVEEATDPTLEEQIDQLRSMDDSEVEEILARSGEGDDDLLKLMPTGYEPGETTASATMLLVTQEQQTDGSGTSSAGEATVDAQLAMGEVDEPGENLTYAVFGSGVASHEFDTSMADSLLVVAPLALLFVLVTLAVAYRDLLDMLLGMLGIGIVLVWTFGFMGWTGLAFNQLMVAVPILLIGLSIDYAIHVFMRHREERLALDDPVNDVPGGGPEEGRLPPEHRETPDSGRLSMRVALSGVGVALVLLTATAAIGFLSNLVSPMPPIRRFGIVTAVGILSALVVFGLLVPALKVTLDGVLERLGFDRRKRAFGTGGGAFTKMLAVGSTAARRIPVVVILVVLLLTAGSVYAAVQVDTTFEEEDFMAEETPGWTDHLPAPFEPGEYAAKGTLEDINENFVRDDTRAQILLEGDVTADDTLQRVAAAEADAGDRAITQELSDGDPLVASPLSVMHDVAAENKTFNATVAAADTTGDGVPDENIESIYNELFRIAPEEAGTVIHRTADGEYEALRMEIATDGSATRPAVKEETREVAAALDDEGLAATATGDVVLTAIVDEHVLDSVVESLLISLLSVVVFLAAVYRLVHGSASLGVVTMLPVVLTVSWIVGTMYLLDIPFDVLTGLVTSLTIGLGVAYSIHISERYVQELSRQESVWSAMETAVTGTGGALLGSAATTVGAFGLLAFSILQPLQLFGLVISLTIVYAFLASVLVLPSFLIVWTHAFGPTVAGQQIRRGRDVAVPSD